MILRRLRKTGPRVALSMAALSFVLLAAQHIAFQHDLDLDSHAPDQVCEICITVTGLDEADVGEPLIALAVGDSPRLSVDQPTLFSEALLKHRLARGPPSTS